MEDYKVDVFSDQINIVKKSRYNFQFVDLGSGLRSKNFMKTYWHRFLQGRSMKLKDILCSHKWSAHKVCKKVHLKCY